MDYFEAIITTLDLTLDSKKRRHIVGGILMSISLLFGGLAFTTMTLRSENKEDEIDEDVYRRTI